MEGLGVKKDYTKAAKLFSKACDGNNANACYNLGVLYESGKGGKSLAIKYPQELLKTSFYLLN